MEKYGIPVKDLFLKVCARTAFHRSDIWELFAIALWDRAVLKGLNPKDPDRAAKRAWPFEGWFPYRSSIFILPLFSEFFLPKTVYPCEVASDEERPPRVLPGKLLIFLLRQGPCQRNIQICMKVLL